MFITSFEEQNITYRSCSNLRIHLYAIQINSEDLASEKAVVDIFKKADPKFSKFKLSKAFLNWAREHSSKDLTQDEIRNCEKLLESINRRLK